MSWDSGNSLCRSAGNAAGAMSAYTAARGLEAHVFMPKDAPDANIAECLAFGADVQLIDGFITDAGAKSAAAAEANGWFDVSTLREPYRVEGKKTMGYEIVEQLGYEVPDVIIYPTGGGTGIVGIWKALGEMEALGWLGTERPRMISVQAEGCAPIASAFEAGNGVRRAVREPFDSGGGNACASGHWRLPDTEGLARKRRHGGNSHRCRDGRGSSRTRVNRGCFRSTRRRRDSRRPQEVD